MAKKLTTAFQIQTILDNDSKWTMDRYGNYIIIRDGRKYRCHFQKTSLRFEYYHESLKEWCNFRSDYYKNIMIDSGKIIVCGVTVN